MADAELVERWERAGRPGIVAPEELTEILTERFGAYQIPLEAYGRPMYSGDEQLQVGELVSLMTITHPEVLSRIYGPDEREAQAVDASEVEEYARALFAEYPRGSDDPVSGDFLNMEHALGRRTSIVIAASDGRVSGYRLLGHSDLVAQMLRAYAPVFVDPEVRSGNRPDSVEFADYLAGLATADRI